MLARTFLGVSLIAFVATALLLIGSISPSYEDCHAKKQQEQSDNIKSQPQEESGLHVTNFLQCEGRFFEENNGLILGLVTAVATGVIAVFTFTLWGTGESQLRHNRVVERAYVKMSHTSPGITWFENDGGFELEIKIQNFGNTPANVTDVLIRPRLFASGQELPKKPPYDRQRIEESFHAFLVKDDFVFYRNPELFRITPEQRHEIDQHDVKLVVLGYVDYIDKFGTRHRAGYARWYDPEIDNRYAGDRRNNLLFVSEEGYNYDRQRKPGEGNDWDNEVG